MKRDRLGGSGWWYGDGSGTIGRKSSAFFERGRGPCRKTYLQ